MYFIVVKKIGLVLGILGGANWSENEMKEVFSSYISCRIVTLLSI